MAQTDRVAMNTDNALKIGLFGANCSSGRAATKVPERWSAHWGECLELARMADQARIDFLLPIGRWKGYGGETDLQGETLETLTWATGLLGATERITIFGTVHAPLFHPLIAAKQCVTADQVGGGRFGLNIVCGWNEGEFEMFGAQQRDHESRYAYAQEWVDIVKLAWTKQEDFDYRGNFFDLHGVRAYPKPVGGSRPVIMNAGGSPVGQAFALRNCDAFFTATASSRLSIEENTRTIRGIKDAASAMGRETEVFTVGQVICRTSKAEAQDYYQHAIVDEADWDAIDSMLANRGMTPQNTPADEFREKRIACARLGVGGYPFIGTPDDIAGELDNLRRAGLRGIAISFVNYLDEFPLFRDEVLPRLEDLGSRARR
ncbi:LLM class flavin-dependent oxidoreductase [Roseiarcaceae bacterium H3SJ34-1]|nr:LLM class flavin-dependent oxidoreductase [Roseiarcaceae bacterium H3SJ34-1]